jgi:hypothetical protein
MNKNVKVTQIGSTAAYITFNNASAAAVMVTDSRDMFANPDAKPKIVSVSDGKTYRGVVPWGENNDLPDQITKKVGKSVDASSDMLFNILAGYGDGVTPVKYTYDSNGKKIAIPVVDNEEINMFFENNNSTIYLLEQLMDMNYFYSTFPEILLNIDEPAKRKVVELNNKEASFSRWEEMNPKTGIIENHFYSSKWVDGTPKAEDIDVTKVLSRKNPILDLKRRIGREPYADAKGTIKDEGVYRYIIPTFFPTPGRFYYPKPPWYSLIESGWLDLAILIPEFKRAMLNNSMSIKYMVYISSEYFPAIFAEENITDKEKKKARIKKEYDDIGNYLAGAPNAGKAVIGRINHAPDGKEIKLIQIVPIETKTAGGEYIEDSETVSNIIHYGNSIHSSLIGSHGKAKTINGTEARELFIIKQALLKPFRDILVYPYYLIKAINKWPPDIHFRVPNIELTTLDKGTGSQKVIS